MVKATCEKCGASHVFDDADVPPSGKVVTCSCGEPVTVMHASAAEMGFSAAPRHPTTAGMGTPKVPGPKETSMGLGASKFPAPPGQEDGGGLLGGPALAAFDDEEVEELGDDDLSFIGGGTDLASVDSPRRSSPLAGAPVVPETQKTPRSALSAALDKIKEKKKGGPRPAGVADLPAPVGAKPTGVTDLPAPVGAKPTGVTDLPAPVGPKPTGITDLPAPVGPRPTGVSDLPAPVGPKPTKGAAKATAMGLGSGVAPSGGITDLPTPVGPTPTKSSDLPTPVGPTPTKSTDLPTPVGPTPSKSTDLPTPVGPTPSKSTDLPTPVGPTPTKSTDLPAPKGFFDDVPQPKRASDGPATARGFFDDVPEPASEGSVAAPKGFFDEMPASGGGSAAPKGFFDDVSEAAEAPPHSAAETERFGSGSSLAGAGAKAPALDLDDLDLSPPTSTGFGASPSGPAGSASPVPPLDLGDLPDLSDRKLDLGETPLELGSPEPPSSMPLDLGGDSNTGAKTGGDRFGEVDLPSLGDEPEAAGGAPGVVTFSKPSGKAPPDVARPAPLKKAAKSDDSALELDDDASDHARARRTGTTADAVDRLDDKLGTDGEAPSKVARGEQKKGKAEKKPRAKMTRKQAIIALGGVAVLALGGTGYWLWNKKRAADAKKQKVANLVSKARASIASDKPQHWAAAARSAEAALRLDRSHAEALGIGAQAYYAGYLDEGTLREKRATAGRGLIRKINEKSVQGVEIDKAEALRAVVEGQPARAITNLQKLIRKHPNDAEAPLYLGWAHGAARQHQQAAAAFAKVLKKSPNRIAAHYGLGQAQFALGHTKEARASFKKAWDLNQGYKDLDGWVDHFGARVGQYRAMKIERYNERETLYLGITKEKDADKGDPRAISLAFALAGAEALRSGRVDEAKVRFDRALELDPRNLDATIGDAQANLAQGRTGEAREKLTTVLESDPGNLDATLVLAEVYVAEGNPDEAQERVDVILKREPPIENQADLARAHLVQGAIFQRDPAGLDLAIAEYEKAVALVSPDVNIRPTITLANALAVHPTAEMRAKGLALLVPLQERAKSDAALSVSLGLAYMSGGQPADAEAWFRAALDMKPDDVETMFQLGLSLYAQERFDDALASITQAFDADHEREDIGLRLAFMYEELKRDDEAETIYKKLISDKKLIGKEPSLNVHARVGRFYARRHQYEAVRAHGEAILAQKAEHPAGLFLRGEILAYEKNFDESIRFYQDAVSVSADPQYYDGLGRALERLQPPALDDALKAYRSAAKRKDYLSPRLGIARIRLIRNEYQKGIEALNEAMALAPENSWVYAQMGHCYLMTSRPRIAATYLDKAVKYDPQNEEAWKILGYTYFDLNKPSKAANALGRAVSEFEKKQLVDPDFDLPWVTEAYRRLGYALRAAGNYPAAIRALEKYLARDPDGAEVQDAKKEILFMKGGR